MIIHGRVKLNDGSIHRIKLDGYETSADLEPCRVLAKGMFRNIRCVLFDVPRIPLNFRMKEEYAT